MASKLRAFTRREVIKRYVVHEGRRKIMIQVLDCNHQITASYDKQDYFRTERDCNECLRMARAEKAAARPSGNGVLSQGLDADVPQETTNKVSEAVERETSVGEGT